MSAKEIAERTLRLAAEATPGTRRAIPKELDGIANPSLRFIVAGDYADQGEPDLIIEVISGDELEADVRLIAHASPENMQTLAQALFDALERERGLREALEKIYDVSISDVPLDLVATTAFVESREALGVSDG